MVIKSTKFFNIESEIDNNTIIYISEYEGEPKKLKATQDFETEHEKKIFYNGDDTPQQEITTSNPINNFFIISSFTIMSTNKQLNININGISTTLNYLSGTIRKNTNSYSKKTTNGFIVTNQLNTSSDTYEVVYLW